MFVFGPKVGVWSILSECAQSILGIYHGLINNIDTKAKCLHLNKLNCKGTLRQVFIRAYKLEIQSVMLVFATKLCELLPL
jgi:hypothetical protein